VPEKFRHYLTAEEFFRAIISTMLAGFGCVIGLAIVIAVARKVRARSTLNQNRIMLDYVRRIASDGNSDF
jgi:hypothetical protein